MAITLCSCLFDDNNTRVWWKKAKLLHVHFYDNKHYNIFKKYDITHVITYENSIMNMIIEKTKDPNYKQLYKDDYFVVYERLSN